jgi:hypothetical protein
MCHRDRSEAIPLFAVRLSKSAGLRELICESVFDDLPWMKTISLFLPGAPGRVKYARRRYARWRTVL